MRKVVYIFQKKELTALEIELQNKVKSLNEHRVKVDLIDGELIEVADKHQKILNLEVCVTKP